MFLGRGERKIPVLLIACLALPLTAPQHRVPASLSQTLPEISSYLAPSSEIPPSPEEILKKREKWQRALDLLRLVRGHYSILGYPFCGEPNKVLEISDDKTKEELSQREEALSETLTFLYTFQTKGLDHLIQILEEALLKSNAPKTVTISFFDGGGIALDTWERLFKPAQGKGLLKKLIVALCEYKLGPSSIKPDAGRYEVLDYDQKGREAFVLQGEEASRVFYLIVPEVVWKRRELNSLQNGLGDGVHWNKARNEICYFDLHRCWWRGFYVRDGYEPGRKDNFKTINGSYLAAITGIEIDLERLVDFLVVDFMGEKNLVRQHAFRILNQLQEAFTQKRKYDKYLSDQGIFVGKKEAQLSSMINHFPSEMFAEPLVIFRLLRLLSCPNPRIPTDIFPNEAVNGDSFLPVYDDEARDNVWEALTRHNPNWFEQSLQFLTAPVEDDTGGALDLFDDEAAFLFQFGWIDEKTRRDLLLEQKNSKGEKILPAVLEQLSRRLPCVSSDFPIRDVYARIKRNAFFNGASSKNYVGRYVRQLKAEEFALQTAQLQREGKSWVDALPFLAFRHYFMRIAHAFIENMGIGKVLYIVCYLHGHVFHRKWDVVSSGLSDNSMVQQLLLLASLLKEVFVNSEEEEEFWHSYPAQAALGKAESDADEKEQEARSKYDDSSIMHRLDIYAAGGRLHGDSVNRHGDSVNRPPSPVIEAFLQARANGIAPSEEAHPVRFHPYYQEFFRYARELAAVEEAL